MKNRPIPLQHRPTRPRALILIAVLVIIALAAMVAATLLFRVRAELAAAGATSRGDQASAAALSGLQTAVATLQSNRDNPAMWSDVPNTFKNQLVADDGSNRWYFTIYADNLDNAGGTSGGSNSTSSSGAGSSSDPSGNFRYGVTDEASKVNINAADQSVLAKLPGLTTDQVASLLAYRGPAGGTPTTKPAANSNSSASTDSTTDSNADSNADSSSDTYKNSTYTAPTYSSSSASGATSDSSAPAGSSASSGSSSTDATAAAGPMHGPLASIDELLQVPNFDAPTLYGTNAANYNLSPPATTDANGTAISSSSSTDGTTPSSSSNSSSSSASSSDGSSGGTVVAAPAAGLQSLITVQSYDRDIDSSAQPRINLNSDTQGLEKLNLNADTLKFIKVSIADGHYFNDPSELYLAQHTISKKIADYPDLKVGEVIDAGVDAGALSLIMDKLTIRTAKDKIPGLINVNTASATVLSTIPGISTDAAQQIVTLRANLSADDRGNLAWLVKQSALDETTFKLAAPYLTTRGKQFSMKCVGFGWPCGRYRVYETVVDLDGDKPRFLFFREITRLGLPITISADELGVTQ